MKIVGIGLNKTGTKTLGACMRYWGFKHISCNTKAFDHWRAGDYRRLMNRIRRFDSFEDWPWPLIFREIDAEFPGSKFILTRRADADTWFNSLCEHAKRTGPTDFRKYIYGHAMPQAHRAEHINFYENHLRTVRDYFRGRPDDLLEVCWEKGDGWAELSQFLGFEKPDLPFPHENKSPGRLATK